MAGLATHHAHEEQHDGQDAGDDQRVEAAIPSQVVHHGTHHDTGEGRADEVAEQAGETRGTAGGLLGHQVGSMQTDHHHRTIDQEADRDQGDVVDERIAGRVLPVHEHGNQHAEHEQDGGRRTPALEHLVAEVTADQHAGDACPFVQEIGQTRALVRIALDLGQIGGRPVHNTVADEVDEDVGDRDQPEDAVVQHILEQDVACRELFLDGFRRGLLRIVVPVFLDGGQATGLRRVLHQEEREDGQDDGDDGREEEDAVPRAEQVDAQTGQRGDQATAQVVRDVPPGPLLAALIGGEPVHHGARIRGVTHALEPAVEEAERAHDGNAAEHAGYQAERQADHGAEQQTDGGKVLGVAAVRDVAHHELAEAVGDGQHGEHDAQLRLGVATFLDDVGHRQREVLAQQIVGGIPQEGAPEDLHSQSLVFRIDAVGRQARDVWCRLHESHHDMCPPLVCR